MFKKSIIFISSFIIFISTSLYSFSFTSLPIWSQSIDTNSSPLIENYLNLESESAILIEESTGQILYEKNSDTPLRPASVTKVMSILLIMESIKNGDISLDTPVPCSEKASSMGGSQIWLSETETLTVHEMLKAICIASANDCTYALAEFISGSEELFVQKMNERAKELGMKNTTFKNCHVLDEDGHLTTSYDIALMSRELLSKHPEIKEYTSTWSDTLRDGASELINTNKLIRTYEGATGLKTGSTSLALYNLSASATRNDLSLIAVIMKAPTPKVRFSEAKILLDYGFNTYEYKLIGKKDALFNTVSIKKGTQDNLDLIYENDFGLLVKKKNSNNITQNIILNEEKMVAPIKKGDILGEINYQLEGEILGSINLCSNVDIPKKSLINYFNFICKNWLNFLR